MRLVLRRARAARGLLLAATGATLVATLLLTALAGYSRDAVAAGARGVLGSAPADERSVLVRGPAGGTPDRQTERDTAVQSTFADGFGGLPARVYGAGYAAGRELTGDVGDAVPGSDGAVFASVVFLDHLADHADLVAGAWPAAGAAPPQVALAEAAAATLHVKAGDRVEITDRFTGRAGAVEIAGVWRPRDARDAYWRLAPGAAEGVRPGSSAYGPFVVPRADFMAGYLRSASAAWLVDLDVAGMDPARPAPVRRAVAYATDRLPGDIGLGSSAVVSTRLDRLSDRLARADLVGRSALVTPILLVVVLGGYALLLVAMLLTEHRRAETALLRARGAGRGQLAGLAARETALVVLPAVVLAPPLATEGLRYADRLPILAGGTLDLVPRLDGVTWLVAVLAVAGCLVAMVGPVLRHGGTYVADLASRSRPRRWAVAQRIGLDLALVVLAVLAWLQLRQYSSPLAGTTLGIDPLLAAAPTLGVLAGAVLALRVLPPLTRLGERFVDRRSWTATVLGTWQAGRRPHVGPVLLLSLAVGAGTLAWCLAATSERSATDQANHAVGADLRLVESGPNPPAGRARQLAGLPGVDRVLAAWREETGLGTNEEPTSVVALDAASAGPVVRLRDDLAGGSPSGVFAAMAAARVGEQTIDVPAGRRLSGQVRTTTAIAALTGESEPEVTEGGPVRTLAVFAVPGGGYRQVPLGESSNDRPLDFSVALPGEPRPPLKLAGFLVDTDGARGMTVTWQLDSLRSDTTPISNTAGAWAGHDGFGAAVSTRFDGTQLYARYKTPAGAGLPSVHVHLALAPAVTTAPIPVAATPQALSALHAHAGEETTLRFTGLELPVRLLRTVDAVPGTPNPSAVLVDLPSLATRLFHEYGVINNPKEWWVSTTAARAVAAAAAAGKVGGVEVLDRRAAAEEARHDPYGVAARTALFAAALGAVLLAAMGIAVDVRATARQRATELTVLHTLGAGPRLLARSLVAEQTFLAGMGVLVGVGVGVAVAVTMAPLVILSPAAERPVPVPLPEIAWWPVGLTTAGLLLLALGLSGLVAWTVRRRLAAAQLRIGDEVA